MTDEIQTPDVDELQSRVSFLEKRITSIQEVGMALGESLNLDEVLAIITEKVTHLLDAERSTLYLVDQRRGKLVSRVMVGEKLKEIILDMGQGIAGWVAKTGQGINLKDAYLDSRFNGDVDSATGFRTRSMLCQPMKTLRGRVVGVIQVMNKRDGGYFPLEDEQLLSSMTTQTAIAVENAKLFSEVLRTNIQLREAQERLKRNYERMELLYRMETEVSNNMNLDALLERILSICHDAVASQAAVLMLSRPDGCTLYHYVSGGEIQRIDHACVGGVMGEVLRTGRSELIEPIRGQSHLPILHPEIEVDVKAAVCEPVPIEGRDPVGVLALANPRGRARVYSEDDIKLVRFLASQVSRVVLRFNRQQELMQAKNLAAIGQALSGVIHDFKTPMTVISGYAQMMQVEDDVEKRAEYSELIFKQFKHLSSMTQEVLAFARGDTQMFKRQIFVDRFLLELRDLLEQEFRGHSIELVMNIGFQGKVRMDESKVRRMIFNLARNAREAMPHGGTFTITAEQKGDADLRLLFSDTGKGIPLDIRHRLFESFVTSGKEDGSGLGLAIVKKIVDDHGGTVEFQSESGQGTTFEVLLPLDA